MNLLLSRDLERNYRDQALNLGIESANAAYAYKECMYVCLCTKLKSGLTWGTNQGNSEPQ